MVRALASFAVNDEGFDDEGGARYKSTCQTMGEQCSSSCGLTPIERRVQPTTPRGHLRPGARAIQLYARHSVRARTGYTTKL